MEPGGTDRKRAEIKNVKKRGKCLMMCKHCGDD